MDKTVLSKGINYGLILGFLLSLVTLYGYGVDQDIFLSTWLMVGLFLITVIFGILAIGSVKKEFEGYISFKEAFSTYFVMVALALLISTAVSIVLFNFVDPTFAETLKEKQIQMLLDMYEQYNVEMTDQMEAQMETLKNTNTFAIPQQIKAYFQGLVIYSVIGLLLALILKSKNPDEA